MPGGKGPVFSSTLLHFFFFFFSLSLLFSHRPLFFLFFDANDIFSLSLAYSLKKNKIKSKQKTAKKSKNKQLDGAAAVDAVACGGKGPDGGAAKPPDEAERVGFLCGLGILDSPADPRFDDITKLVSGLKQRKKGN